MSILYTPDGTALETETQETPVEEADLFLDPDRLFPSPVTRLIKCSGCGVRPAKWAFVPTTTVKGYEEQGNLGSILICAHCFLYNSGWGKKRRERIDRMIQRSEDNIRAKTLASIPVTTNAIDPVSIFSFEKDSEGKLVHTDDCDKILAAISLMSVAVLAQHESLLQDSAIREGVYGDQPQFTLKE